MHKRCGRRQEAGRTLPVAESTPPEAEGRRQAA